MSDDLPFVAIGYDQLEGAVGAEELCPNCNALHAVSTVGSKDSSLTLQTITCPSSGHLYLLGLNGRLIRWPGR